MVFLSCCSALVVYNFFNNGFIFGRWGYWSHTGMSCPPFSVGIHTNVAPVDGRALRLWADSGGR